MGIIIIVTIRLLLSWFFFSVGWNKKDSLWHPATVKRPNGTPRAPGCGQFEPHSLRWLFIPYSYNLFNWHYWVVSVIYAFVCCGYAAPLSKQNSRSLCPALPRDPRVRVTKTSADSISFHRIYFIFLHLFVVVVGIFFSSALYANVCNTNLISGEYVCRVKSTAIKLNVVCSSQWMMRSADLISDVHSSTVCVCVPLPEPLQFQHRLNWDICRRRRRRLPSRSRASLPERERTF